jgi:hypothetical protein
LIVAVVALVSLKHVLVHGSDRNLLSRVFEAGVARSMREIYFVASNRVEVVVGILVDLAVIQAYICTISAPESATVHNPRRRKLCDNGNGNVPGS